MKQKNIPPRFVAKPPTNMTGQTSVEKALRQSQFLDVVPGYFYTLQRSPEGRYVITFASAGLRELFGLEPDAVMLDIAVFDAATYPEDREMLLRNIEASASDLSPCHIEYRISHPLKGMRWVESHSQPQRTEDGGTRWDGFMHDITEHKRLEIELRAREREFRSLAENLPDNIARWDINGSLLYSNPTYQRTLGKPFCELNGKRQSVLFPDGPLARGDETVMRIAASGRPEFLRTTVPHENGESSIHDINVVPEFDELGKIVSVLEISRDMTAVYRMQEAIAAREQQFRGLAESSPDSIVSYDREGRHRYLNNTLLRKLGLSSIDEVAGKRPSEVWPDGRFDQIEQASLRAVELGNPVTIELVKPLGGGNFSIGRIDVVPEYDIAGTIVGTIAFGRDITVNREVELRLKHFIDNLPGFAFTFRVTSDGRFSFPYASPAIYEFYGLQPEDVKDDAATLHALAHPDDQPRIEAAIFEAKRMMMPIHFEFRVCRPGLPERWLEVSSEPEPLSDGNILWYGIMLDITERKRIGEQHRLKEFALDRMHEAAYLFDAINLHFIYVNEAACRSLGYSREELLVFTVPDIDPYLSPELVRHIQEWLLADGSVIIESRHRRRDGSSFPVEVQSSQFEYQGQILVLALVRDISERKQAEQALEESRTQLRGLVSQREAAREEERRNIAREVHDNLGQILSGLHLNISRFKRRYAANSAGMQQQLQEIGELIELAVGEVRNISAALRPVERDMDIGAALASHLERFSAYSGIECELHIEENVNIPVDEHSLALFRIAQESLTNVARHAQAKRVEVSLVMDAQDHILRIRDNGIGFCTNERKTKSFGLVGMRERAAMLGGVIVINSCLGKGTEITVRIPVQGAEEKS